MASIFPSPAVALCALTLTLAMGLGGCAAGMIDALPAAVGGEPANLPKRPATSYKFPAVHDMPPERAATPLTDNEQVRLEKELMDARDKQGALAAEPPLNVEGVPEPAAAKKPATAKSGQSTGAKTKP